MSVAVIIPLFDGERWIGRTLDAVRCQQLAPAEIVVVDDGSTDRSMEIASAHRGIRLLRNPTKGANAARRYGCAQSSAPFVAFLDQDDLWHPEHLSRQMQGMRQLKVFGALSVAECSIHGVRQAPAWRFDDKRRRTFDAWPMFPFGPRVGTPSAVLIRRSALDAIGGWPVDYPGLADYFAWLGLSANGSPRSGFAFPHTCTMARQRHRTSYSATLRTGEALERYSDSLRRASEDAAARFGPQSTLDAATLARRTGWAAQFHALMAAFARGEWDAFAETARQLWAEVARDSPEIQAKFGAMACWMFDGRRTRAEALETLDRVLACWPADDGATRKLLQRQRAVWQARPATVSSLRPGADSSI